jgi:hypothetical protein
VFCRTWVIDSSPLVPEIYIKIYLDITSGISHPIYQQKSNRRDPSMNFNHLADETFTDAWERYHGLKIVLPTASMEDWKFTQGFYCGLSQEAKEHIDTLARGGFFMLNAEEVWALFVKLSVGEGESEEHGLKEISRTDEIDPLTRMFQGIDLTQHAASETHQAE